MVYIGSNAVQTTTAQNTEIVTYLGKNGDYKEPDRLKTLSFSCLQDCKVKINGSEEIFVPANATLDFDKGNEPISSFIIVGNGVSYMWIATV